MRATRTLHCARRLILAGLLLLAAAPAPAVPVSGGGETVDIALPPGFQPATNRAAGPAGLPDSFVLDDAQNADSGITLNLRPLARPSRQLRTPNDWMVSLPSDLEFAAVETNTRAAARRFDMARGRVIGGGNDRVAQMLRIPLRSQSLLLTVESSTSRTAQASAMMDMIVTSLGTNRAVGPQDPGPEGWDFPWMKTIIYLVLAAAILLVGAKSATLMPGRR
jgi:hypothetical protein